MKEFREAVERRDFDGLIGLFSDDIVFRSPAVYAPYRGRAEVQRLLGGVTQVLQDFRFVREIGASDAADHGLVFRARVGDREVEGCDLMHVNAEGLIDELVVMFRPLSGLLAMSEAMTRQLGGERAESGHH